MKKRLQTVTLIGIDCVDIDRLILAADICEKDFEFAETKLLTLLPSADPRVVRISAIDSVQAYSEFCIAKLDSFIDTPHTLIIQHDGFILNPAAWTKEFLKYDYIGSPWLVSKHQVKKYEFKADQVGKLVVGNGGFSLRSKRFLTLCAELSRAGVFKTYHPEDVELSVHKRALLEEKGMRFAPPGLAERFSFEAKTEADDKWDGQFGFHGLRWTDISKWLAAHPEYPIKNELRKNKKKGEEMKK